MKRMLIGSVALAVLASTPAFAAGPFDGDWRAEGLEFSYVTNGEVLTMTSRLGNTYTARFGGPPTPIKGEDPGSSVAVERFGNRGFVEIHRRAGKIESINTIVADAAGKALTISAQGPGRENESVQAIRSR